MLRSIHIEQFGILKDVTIGPTSEEIQAALQRKEKITGSLSALSCFIGRNGTGKSAFLGSISFIRDALLYGLPHASSSGQRGGFARLRTRQLPLYEGEIWSLESRIPRTFPEDSRAAAEGSSEKKNMVFDFIYERRPEQYLHYHISMNGDKHSRPFIYEETVRLLSSEGEKELLSVREGKGHVSSERFGNDVVQLLDEKVPALSLFGRMLQYKELCWLYLQLTSSFVCRPAEMPDKGLLAKEKGGHKHLNERMDNLRNVLNYREKEDPKAYEQLLSRILDQVPDYKKVGDAFLDQGISSGNLRLFAMLLLLEDLRALICIDEPDNGLYHDMIEALMQAMRHYILEQKDAQIFLTTHNSSVLEALSPEEVWALERKNDGQIHVRSLAQDEIVRQMYKEGINMGMLWYGGHLGVN